ncbi:MAG: TlyA family RNA methyltransferase [Hyphomicrobiales bacterium]|nr:TlyA family RNA methyltransferase [Rickettsiales bacterium]MCP5362183.1 TlyA family RNA methyltransferase [Hyphomicrobiales bacterium]
MASPTHRIRLDALLVARGLAASQAEAEALIRAGEVRSGDRRLDKPGQSVKADISLEVKSRRGHAWVSRGGLKLEGALKIFSLSPEGCIAADIGASTGGFTDVLLQHGAAKVYAVDVGYGQLDWKLQQDPRVVVLDRTNARHLTREQIPEPPAFIVSDVSFISLRTALPAVLSLAALGAICVALIKPQFELPKEDIPDGGVVTDAALHEKACHLVKDWVLSQEYTVLGITESPITGQKGNQEFLIGFQLP